MKKKVLATMMAGMMVAGLLAGCGSTASTTTASASSEAASVEEAVEEEVAEAEEAVEEEAAETEEAVEETADADFPTGDIEFTWMHHLQEEGKQAWVQYCIDTFTEEHPNVTINVEVLTADNYDTMLKTKIASGDAPMIFDAGTATFPEYVAAGYCADVSGLEEYANFDEGTLNQGRVDGVQYGVPLDVNGYCVFYNKDIFEENNIEIPTTPDELTAVCQTLQDAGVQPFSCGFSEQWCLRRFADYLDVLCVKDNPDWYAQKMSGESTFSDDELFKEAMDLLARNSEFWGDDPFAETWSDVQNKIATGQAAMTINGSWITSGVSSINPDCNLGAFALPIDDNPDDAIMIEKPGNNFCVYNNTEDADTMTVAMEFFKFMCSQDSAAFYAVSAQGLTGAHVDVDAGSCINEVNAYTGDKLYVQSGITTFNSEYNGAFQDVLQEYMNSDNIDIDAMCAALDESFASIQ